MKLFKSLLVILTFLVLPFFHSCEEPAPPVPDCEKYGYGEVVIVNKTGYSLWVDCTYILSGTNYEKLLYNNGSYTYEMSEGKVYIWGSINGNDWVYDTYFLDACEKLTYKWYLDKKKSTDDGLYVVVENDGVAVDTLKAFELIEK